MPGTPRDRHVLESPAQGPRQLFTVLVGNGVPLRVPLRVALRVAIRVAITKGS